MAKVSLSQVNAALLPLQDWLSHPELQEPADKNAFVHATRITVQYFSQVAPGRAVELRIPPWIAVQIIAGSSHARGIPPNVIEMPAAVWLRVFVGKIAYSAALHQGLIEASGVKCAEIENFLPVPLVKT